jgi:hypothetical protein
VIKTPNWRTLDYQLFKKNNWGGYHCPRHWVIFSRKALSNLGDLCGLTIDSINFTQGAPQWTTSILGYLSDRKWISVTKENPMYTHMLYKPMLLLTAAFDFMRAPFAPTAQMVVVFRKKAA